MSAETDAPCAIRPAHAGDIGTIMRFVRALAEFEHLAGRVTADEEILAHHLFGPRPRAECLIAEVSDKAAGFALYFHNFSTFTGRPGLYLEDIFVAPEFRRHGIGLALFRELAKIALARDCARMEWAVLDWNENAIGFYRGLGAEPMSDWTVQRLSQKEMKALANGTGNDREIVQDEPR